MKNYSKNGIIKKDLYIIKAGFDYDENFETQFRVKFINLTDEVIESVQIGDIEIETRYPYTNKYFKEHVFNVSGCIIMPGEIKFVTFSPNKETTEERMMQYQRGVGAKIYNLDYIKANGEHVNANRNISTNLKWTTKKGIGIR
ncbi:MAG: hypothetical protein ACOYLT_10520 [Flavobacterium sp.]|uniref:hypothetical protein n=1 Tax=Flavobacterium sp. TaxID=239 RepID=UPI003BEC53FA